ncbi:DUF624 domain-containing protein [Gracilibacillus caseinilyticus]|uniref:DUF624 domain-containing protein n=1 Tax=Gracilibacillus caseinilyticus TaxID=2932256 RepID=A0ABY4F129_9BACI|nr:DUF624 domain-containing protein [Gracilibacillus caseinilyticus]UOQ50380.1 DUF624 domain-containing protein [Gracilibacillus caseinilyticus]
MSGGAYGILRIPEWILKFAYLTVLWVIFSMAGLIAFGVFPATAALMAIQRQWLKKDADVSVLANFIHYYKKNFVKSNLVGYLWGTIVFTLYVYFQLIQLLDGPLYTFTFYGLVVTTLLSVLTAAYSFAVLVHFELPLFYVIKNAFLIMIVSPLTSVMIVSGCVILFFVFRHHPGLLVIFGPSVFTFLVLFSSYLAFLHIEKKQERQFMHTVKKVRSE